MAAVYEGQSLAASEAWPDRSAFLHGRALVIGERLVRDQDKNPLWLILHPEFGPDAWLLSRPSYNSSSSSRILRAAMTQAPKEL